MILLGKDLKIFLAVGKSYILIRKSGLLHDIVCGKDV